MTDADIMRGRPLDDVSPQRAILEVVGDERRSVGAVIEDALEATDADTRAVAAALDALIANGELYQPTRRTVARTHPVTDGGVSVDGIERYIDYECPECGEQYDPYMQGEKCPECGFNPSHGKDWKLAEITLNSPGPRYLIRGERLSEAVDRVEFNGFRLGLDGRAEVEYIELEIVEEDFHSTAKFFDRKRSLQTDTNRSEGGVQR